jgi:hypothetical protein
MKKQTNVIEGHRKVIHKSKPDPSFSAKGFESRSTRKFTINKEKIGENIEVATDLITGALYLVLLVVLYLAAIYSVFIVVYKMHDTAALYYPLVSWVVIVAISTGLTYVVSHIYAMHAVKKEARGG